MVQFSMELDLVSREIERLTAEVNRLQTEYDLDDGVNDDAEQAEIDALFMGIGDLQERRERLEAEADGAMPYVDPTPVLNLEPINIEASGMISYYEDELQQFMGTRMAGWASRCSQMILGARTELNVQVPDNGFDVTNLVEVISLVPVVGPFADAGNKIYGLLETTVNAINVVPETSFADIGHDLSNAFVDLQGQMERDSAERQELYGLWVEAYRAGDPNDQVPRDLIRRDIESWVATQPEPRLIARQFLLSCMQCLDDPVIEMDPFYESDGYETGDVTLYFSYREGSFSFRSGYIDDAPQQLVDALRRNFGPATRCVDLPLAMRCQISVYYRDRDDEDDDDDTREWVNSSFLARRRSRSPGNTRFAYSLETGRGAEGEAKQEALAAWESQQPYLRISLGQLSGD